MMNNLPTILIVAESGYQQKGLSAVVKALLSVNVLTVRKEAAIELLLNGVNPIITLIDSSVAPSERDCLLSTIKRCSAYIPCVLLVNGCTNSTLPEILDHRFDRIINRAGPITKLRTELLKVIELYRCNGEEDPDEKRYLRPGTETVQVVRRSGIQNEI
jgi:hypothetical protein